MSVKEGLIQLSGNLRAATVTAVSTGGAGAASWLDFIPDDIGKLGVLITGCLSVVLIFTWIRRGFYDKTQHELDVRLKEQQIEINQSVLEDVEEAEESTV